MGAAGLRPFRIDRIIGGPSISRQTGFCLWQPYFNEDIANPDLYDLVLNQAMLSMDSIVDIVVLGMESRGLIHPDTGYGRKESDAVKVA